MDSPTTLNFKASATRLRSVLAVRTALCAELGQPLALWWRIRTQEPREIIEVQTLQARGVTLRHNREAIKEPAPRG